MTAGCSINKALRLAQRALQLQPKSGLIMDTLGWVYYQQGNLTEAERQFRAASELGFASEMVENFRLQASPGVW